MRYYGICVHTSTADPFSIVVELAPVRILFGTLSVDVSCKRILLVGIPSALLAICSERKAVTLSMFYIGAFIELNVTDQWVQLYSKIKKY